MFFLSTSLLTACSSIQRNFSQPELSRKSTSSQPSAKPLNTSTAAKTTEQLLREESLNPTSSKIKIQLAERFECLGRPGLAFEHWKWVARYASSEQERILARERLQMLRSKSQPSSPEPQCP